MKKRLLSAALALAMVLTMLPLSVIPAFAASNITPADGWTAGNLTDPETSYAVTYHDANAKDSYGNTFNTAGWYYTNVVTKKIYYASSGVVTNTGAWTNNTSGTWWANPNVATQHNATSFKLIDTAEIKGHSSGAMWDSVGSLSIDLNGKTLTWNVSNTNRLTQLTLTDSAGGGSINNSATLTVTGRSFTLNNGNTNGTYPADASKLSVTLTNTQTGTVWTSGALTVNNYGGKLGAIKTKNAKGTIRVTNFGEVSAVNLGESSDMDNRSGGSVTLETRSKASSVFIVGTGSLSMSGMSSVGGVQLYGGNAGNTTAGTVPTWNGTTVTVDGASTVYSISQGGGDAAGKHSITVQNRSTITNGITLNQGGSNTVKISDSTVKNPGIKMARGSLTVTNSSIEDITAAKPIIDGNTSGLSITVGTRNQADSSNTGNINREDGNTIIPALTINGGTVGQIKDNGTEETDAYSIELWGGKTGTVVPKESLKGGLAEGYLVRKGTSYLYTTDFQDLIDNYSVDGSFDAYRVNDDTAISGTSRQRVVFMYEPTKPLTEIQITPGTYVKLPTKVNNTEVKYWHDTSSYEAGGTKEALEAGKSYLFPKTGNILLTVQLAPDTSNTVTGVKAQDNDPAGTPIGCTLNGTTVNLSGAVTTTGNTATITVTFTMNDGTTRKATVGWATDGTITVSKPDDAGDGVVLPTLHGNTVQIYNTTYTFNGSGLRGKVSGITVGSLSSVAISVPNASAGMSGAFVELGKKLKNTLTDSASFAKFDGADGVKMALNALIAGQTENSLNGIINQARNAMVAYDNRAKTGGRTDHKVTDTDYTAYRNVVLTPYLEISSSNPTTTTGTAANPILTLNITLKYRYTVTKTPGGTDAAYKDKDALGKLIDWEQTGNLNVTGDYGTVEITLKMPTNLAFSGTSYAHHNGYVYSMTWQPSNYATIKNVNGFSPFVINNTKPAVTIAEQSGYGFDNLQTAVDAVKDGQNIVMHENFTGSINLTGAARKFTIKADDTSTKEVTVNLTGVNGASTTYEFNTSSNQYEIQLAANTVTPTGEVAITVASVANGYARVSASKAKPGTVVTITATPNAGYVAGTPSVRYTTKTSTNNVLNVAAAGTNTWTFTVPTDATGVTVTPSFVRTVTSTLPFNDVATNAWYYSGVEYCWNTTRNGYHLMEGVNSNNTQFSPNNTFTRAQMVQVLWNIKGRPTPGAARKTYTDVSPNQWYYNAIVWATNNGYADGFGDGRFGPDRPVKRDELVEFLWKFAGRPSGTGNLNVYADRASVPLWAQNSMRWATGYNILSGQNSVSLGSLLSAESYAMRSEVAVTVTQYHGRYGG